MTKFLLQDMNKRISQGPIWIFFVPDTKQYDGQLEELAKKMSTVFFAVDNAAEADYARYTSK